MADTCRKINRKIKNSNWGAKGGGGGEEGGLNCKRCYNSSIFGWIIAPFKMEGAYI